MKQKRKRQTLILRFSWQYQPTYKPQKDRKIKKNRPRERRKKRRSGDDDDDDVLFLKYLRIWNYAREKEKRGVSPTIFSTIVVYRRQTEKLVIVLSHLMRLYADTYRYRIG
jgi:hypothetical protein